MRKINMNEELIDNIARTTGKYFDKKIMEALTYSPLGETIVGYRKIKEPVFLKIKIPVIAKDYDIEFGDFRGYLISFKEVNLFKIGSKMVEKPIYKKTKPKVIKFKRYSPLSSN